MLTFLTFTVIGTVSGAACGYRHMSPSDCLDGFALSMSWRDGHSRQRLRSLVGLASHSFVDGYQRRNY